MTTLHLLALAGYFLLLTEFIAMRHRDICAESDDQMCCALADERIDALSAGFDEYVWSFVKEDLYWNRGTK